MGRDYNSRDYDDYDSGDYQGNERPEDRLRARFAQRRQDLGRPAASEDYYESPPASPRGDQRGCNRTLLFGGIALALLIALFRGGIFNGEVSLPRRGCQWIMSAAFLGVVLIGGAVFMASSPDADGAVVAGAGFCGSLLCLGSGGGLIIAFITGTKLLSLANFGAEDIVGGNIMDTVRNLGDRGRN